MMNHTQLRRVLKERSATPPATTNQGRAAGVRRKVLARRRRRVGAGAGAGVLVAALLGVAVSQLPGGAEPAPEAGTFYPAASFPEYLNGTRIVETASAQLADSSFTINFESTASDLVLYSRCDDHGIDDENLGLTAEFSMGGKTVERRLCALVASTEPDVWESFETDLGIEPGETAAVTITVTEITPQAIDIDEPPPLPSQGTMSIAVAEPVPFTEYPLPAPPANPTPLPDTESWNLELRADPSDPNRRIEAITAWDASLVGCHGRGRSYPLELVSQTPGTLRVLIDDIEVAEHTWWDYHQMGHVERLDPLCSQLVNGDEVTIAVVPEHMTGDWQVVLNQSGG